jgi:hypothetical protein
MTEKTYLIDLLQNTVEGLTRRGYREWGGSDVFRIMKNDSNKTTIKIFLNNYEDPTHIILRFSDIGEQYE